MGLFSMFKRKSVEETIEVTTISKGTKIENGGLVLDSDLIIEGEYSGSIKSTKGIIVGKAGIIKGSVIAGKIILSGKIEGEVDCDTIEVLDEARISGEVIARSFIMGDGGIFEGIMKKK